MPLAQLHDLMQYCPECSQRNMDTRRVQLAVKAGQAVVVNAHSECGHILMYRNIHPVRYGPDPEEIVELTPRRHTAYDDPRTDPDTRNGYKAAWRRMSA